MNVSVLSKHINLKKNSMKSIYVKIWLLIAFVVTILLVNTVFNRMVINKNEVMHNQKNDINLILRHLVDLNYITIVIDDLQDNLTPNNEEVKKKIIALKNQEFELIDQNRALLLKNGFYTNDIKQSIEILENNEAIFKSFMHSNSIEKWVEMNKHESIHLSIAIKAIEENLYKNRVVLMTQTASNLDVINYIDIVQDIIIVIITLVIVRMLINDNNKQTELIAELKQINATKDKFFSIISHDLRSPFNAILGFTEVLQKEFHTYPQEQTHQYLTYIQQAARKTFDLLENLLEWSSLQIGKYVPRFKMIPVSEIILDEIDLLHSTAKHKFIDLHTHFSNDSVVMVDKHMMNTVFRNLISNAIKFTDVNGKIEITVTEKDSEVFIAISDNGVGIDQSTIDNLFKIDSKISTIGTHGEKGTGLGLLLCKELVEKNHGKINIESEIGVGTTFTITLPKANNLM